MLQSVSEVEMIKVVDLGGHSIGELLGEGELQVQVATGEITAEGVVGESGSVVLLLVRQP